MKLYAMEVVNWSKTHFSGTYIPTEASSTVTGGDIGLLLAE
jgi:hypothetical protein